VGGVFGTHHCCGWVGSEDSIHPTGTTIANGPGEKADDPDFEGRQRMKPATTSATPSLIFEVKEEAAYITLNRPVKRNALSRQLLSELESTLAGVAVDSGIRVVVIASNGAVFCSGHDLNEMIGCSEEAYRELFTLCSKVMMQIRRMPQPVIARVQGVATAAGCQLVASCDLVVAAEHATFATPGVKIGLFCTTPMVPLVRSIPAKPALEMLLTGEPIPASRAFELGLVNRVVPAADASQLDQAVKYYVDMIRSFSPSIIRLGKAAFYDQKNLAEATAYDRATEIMVANAMLQDAQNGMQAFLQKRKPMWAQPRDSP
jgi:enoyl-CoA hydratase/carnithine racemase